MALQTLTEAVAQLRAELENGASRPRLVADWQAQIPSGSRWSPEMLGNADCPTCKGMGYVRFDLPINHTLFGKLFICECAQEKAQARDMRRLQSVSRLAPDDLRLAWLGMIQTPAIENARLAMRRTLERGWGWVYAHGGPGPGKTLLLKTAVAESVRAGKSAVFVEWADLLQHLRDGYGQEDYPSRLENWRRVELLAIDEFKRAKDSDWVEEVKARLLSYRYEQAVYRKSITLFASNFGPAMIDDWLADRMSDGRFDVLDRLAGGGVVEVDGPSLRPAMVAEDE